MILMSRKFIPLVALLTFLIVGGVHPIVLPAHATTSIQSMNSRVEITVTILDAYYTDAEGDGYEDDVLGFFDITLEGSERFNFDIYLSLTLPSGLKYTYAYVINTRLNVLNCVMYFYDHATESGDYTFTVEIVSYTGGVAYGCAELVFDPPGGAGDTDPCGSLVIM